MRFITHDEAIADLPQGWFHHSHKIYDLLNQHRPQVCVELGTWRGASAIATARIVRQWGGVVYCVDAWTGDVNSGSGGPHQILECAYNITRAGVGPNVRLIPATTDQAFHAWDRDTHIEYLYVDADHSQEQTYRDLEQWTGLFQYGALIAGDDYGSPLYPGVKLAWDDFESRYGYHFTREHSPVEPDLQLIYGTV